MYIEKVQLMKNGGKNKSVAFIILVSVYRNDNILYCLNFSIPVL